MDVRGREIFRYTQHSTSGRITFNWLSREHIWFVSEIGDFRVSVLFIFYNNFETDSRAEAIGLLQLSKIVMQKIVF